MYESVVSAQHGPCWMQECSTCLIARTEGLHSWMRHLISEHVLPTEWPSERVGRLTGPMAQRPYTAITESKKKRKKDSIPRPLNSFMLFAQHIRRNVLRIFNDASNSVISQQLGDLWRSVPRNYRNLYDEEANRLVKIHQLEYPDYKYQPKKRQHQPPTVAASTSCTNFDTRQSSDWSNPSAEPSIPSSSVFVYGSLNSAESEVTTSPSSLPHFLFKTEKKSFSNPISKASATVQPGLCIKPDSPQHLTQYPRASDSFTFTASEHDDSTTLSIKSTFKRKRWESSGGRVESVRSSSFLTGNNYTLSTCEVNSESGLSSVLPPLIMSNSGRSNHDSAYASGINSSSSSSASSPAIGDVSPNKLTATYCSKASPTRRRFQFIPIRPRSQQAISIPGPQRIGRQRFLSANNDCCSSGAYDLTPSPLTLSPDSPTDCIAGKTTSVTGFDAINIQELAPVFQNTTGTEGIIDSSNMDLIAPVLSIVRKPGEKMKTVGHTTTAVSRRVLVNNAADSSLPSGRLVQILRNSNSKVINSVRPMSAACCNSQMIVSEGYRCTQQLLAPSTTSPLTGTNQIHTPHVCNARSLPKADSPKLGNRLRSTSGHLIKVSKIVTDCPSVSHTLMTVHDKPLVYQMHHTKYESDPQAVTMLSNEPTAPEENDSILSLSDGTNAVLVDGIITDWWPNAMAVFDVDKQSTVHTKNPVQSVEMTPSEENSDNVITVSSPSSDGRCSPIAEKTVSDSDPTSDVNDVDAESFDCNFDLMMNSIDISSFLPDPFSINVNGTYDNQFATDPKLDIMTLPGVYDDPNVAENTLIPDISTVLYHNTNKKSSRFRNANSGDCDRETSGSSLSPTNDQFRQYKLDNAEVNCLDNIEVCHSSTLAQHDQEDSLLSDLDALDKSSLFPLKPDWSILA